MWAAGPHLMYLPGEREREREERREKRERKRIENPQHGTLHGTSQAVEYRFDPFKAHHACIRTLDNAYHEHWLM